MAWSKKQRMKFAATCRTAGLDDEQRHLILMQCDNRAIHRGRATSKSPKLTQADFEHCMGVIAPGRYDQPADGEAKRLRYRIEQLVTKLEADGLLEPDGQGLAGWIAKRVTNDRTDKLAELITRQLSTLLTQLTHYQKHHEAREEAGVEQATEATAG